MATTCASGCAAQLQGGQGSLRSSSPVEAKACTRKTVKRQREDCEGALRDCKSHALPTPSTTRSGLTTRRAADTNMTDCMPSVRLQSLVVSVSPVAQAMPEEGSRGRGVLAQLLVSIVTGFTRLPRSRRGEPILARQPKPSNITSLGGQKKPENAFLKAGSPINEFGLLHGSSALDKVLPVFYSSRKLRFRAQSPRLSSPGLHLLRATCLF